MNCTLIVYSISSVNLQIHDIEKCTKDISCTRIGWTNVWFMNIVQIVIHYLK